MSDRGEFNKDLKKKSKEQIVREILSRLGVNENIIALVLHQSEIQEDVLSILNSILEFKKIPTISTMDGNANNIADAVKALKTSTVLPITVIKERMSSAIIRSPGNIESLSYLGISIDKEGNIKTQHVRWKYLREDGSYFGEDERSYSYYPQKDKIKCKQVCNVMHDRPEDGSVLTEKVAHYTEKEELLEGEYTPDGKIGLSKKRCKGPKTIKGECRFSTDMIEWTRDPKNPLIALVQEGKIELGDYRKSFQLAIDTNSIEKKTGKKPIFTTREQAIKYCESHQREITDEIMRSPNGEALFEYIKKINRESEQLKDNSTEHEVPGE